jgi:hypothetical protein
LKIGNSLKPIKPWIPAANHLAETRTNTIKMPQARRPQDWTERGCRLWIRSPKKLSG